MKLTELPIVQMIRENAEKGYYPNDENVTRFVRDIIPYLEQLEHRLTKIERRMSTGGRKGI